MTTREVVLQRLASAADAGDTRDLEYMFAFIDRNGAKFGFSGALDAACSFPRGETLAFLAARGGHVAALELLSNRFGPEFLCTAKQNGQTPIHWASAMAHAHVVAFLLRSGADVDCFDDTQQSAIELCGAWAVAAPELIRYDRAAQRTAAVLLENVHARLAGWTIERHLCFPIASRRAVVALLVAARVGQEAGALQRASAQALVHWLRILPNELLHLMFRAMTWVAIVAPVPVAPADFVHGREASDDEDVHEQSDEWSDG